MLHLHPAHIADEGLALVGFDHGREYAHTRLGFRFVPRDGVGVPGAFAHNAEAFALAQQHLAVRRCGHVQAQADLLQGEEAWSEAAAAYESAAQAYRAASDVGSAASALRSPVAPSRPRSSQ